MHEQVPQLRMGRAVGGHNGATGGLFAEINTALGTGVVTVFRSHLSAIGLCIRPDKPGDHRLHNFPLCRSGGIEECEVKQGIGMGVHVYKRDNAQHCLRTNKSKFNLIYPQNKITPFRCDPSPKNWDIEKFKSTT
jgi:hypothetical protein